MHQLAQTHRLESCCSGCLSDSLQALCHTNYGTRQLLFEDETDKFGLIVKLLIQVMLAPATHAAEKMRQENNTRKYAQYPVEAMPAQLAVPHRCTATISAEQSRSMTVCNQSLQP